MNIGADLWAKAMVAQRICEIGDNCCAFKKSFFPFCTDDIAKVLLRLRTLSDEAQDFWEAGRWDEADGSCQRGEAALLELTQLVRKANIPCSNVYEKMLYSQRVLMNEEQS